MVETFQGAGVISRDLESHYLGRVGLFRNQPGDILVAEADVLITVGYDAVEYDPGLWNDDPARTVIHIDSLPAGDRQRTTSPSANCAATSPTHSSSSPGCCPG